MSRPDPVRALLLASGHCDIRDCGWGSGMPSESRQVRRHRRRGEPVTLEPGPGEPLES